MKLEAVKISYKTRKTVITSLLSSVGNILQKDRSQKFSFWLILKREI